MFSVITAHLRLICVEPLPISWKPRWSTGTVVESAEPHHPGDRGHELRHARRHRGGSAPEEVSSSLQASTLARHLASLEIECSSAPPSMWSLMNTGTDASGSAAATAVTKRLDALRAAPDCLRLRARGP